VRFEAVITGTASTLRQICDFVDLPYDGAMAEHHLRAAHRLGEYKGQSAPDGTPFLSREQRLAQQVRATQPPDPAAVAAWKHRMSLDERTRFQAVAGDLLRDLGYDT